MRTCSHCKKKVSDTARKCKYCWNWINDLEKDENTNSDRIVSTKISESKNKNSVFNCFVFIFLLFVVILLIILITYQSTNDKGKRDVEDYAFYTLEYVKNYDVWCLDCVIAPEIDWPTFNDYFNVSKSGYWTIEFMKKEYLNTYQNFITSAEADDVLTISADVYFINSTNLEFAMYCDNFVDIKGTEFCNNIITHAETLKEMISDNNYELDLSKKF